MHETRVTRSASLIALNVAVLLVRTVNTTRAAKLSLPTRDSTCRFAIDRFAVVSLSSNRSSQSLRSGNVSCLRTVPMPMLMPRNVNS